MQGALYRRVLCCVCVCKNEVVSGSAALLLLCSSKVEQALLLNAAGWQTLCARCWVQHIVLSDENDIKHNRGKAQAKLDWVAHTARRGGGGKGAGREVR